ncbi:hypothetical protein [Odoribacter lunatus]|uniref:hypothetical protein n=1 Tax=Odoribacter lunatus TaxID=2941335 RepID=UPI0020411E60|nr:hypothetical protein [Odoribacter lunatus]
MMKNQRGKTGGRKVVRSWFGGYPANGRNKKARKNLFPPIAGRNFYERMTSRKLRQEKTRY